MHEKHTGEQSLSVWRMILLLTFFPVLTAERIISLVRFFPENGNTRDALDIYMSVLIIISLIGAYAFITFRCKSVFRFSKLFDKDSDALSDKSFQRLSTAAGILLLGGTAHIKGTLLPLQFAAYGMIIASMVLHTVRSAEKSRYADKKWLKFAYLSAYFLAIPPVHYTETDMPFLFFPIECAVSAGMVMMFEIMLARFYNSDSETYFTLLPFLMALIGDFTVLIMCLEENTVMFSLLPLCLMTVLWFAANVMGIRRKRK